MSCDEYLSNLTRILASLGLPKGEGSSVLEVVGDGIYYIGIPIMCSFGILGNILNIIVLTRKQMSQNMERMAKSVHLGLVALAVSDMLFCATILPSAFIPQTMEYTGKSSMGMVYYNAYNGPFINIFLITSTWLTISMASGRYFAVCHPLHAREILGAKMTRCTIAGVFVVGLLVNLPQFWKFTIVETSCAARCQCYSITTSALYKNKNFEFGYNLFWCLIGVFIPLVILAFCNLCLIKALRQSQRMRKHYRATKSTPDSGHRLTPTLISIVILFMVLVSPSEILKFLTEYVLSNPQDKDQYVAFQTAQIVTNFMQVVNFASNFVLYCVLNVHFRQTMKRVLFCRPEKPDMYKTSQQTTTAVVNISSSENETGV